MKKLMLILIVTLLLATPVSAKNDPKYINNKFTLVWFESDFNDSSDLNKFFNLYDVINYNAGSYSISNSEFRVKSVADKTIIFLPKEPIYSGTIITKVKIYNINYFDDYIVGNFQFVWNGKHKIAVRRSSYSFSNTNLDWSKYHVLVLSIDSYHHVVNFKLTFYGSSLYSVADTVRFDNVTILVNRIGIDIEPHSPASIFALDYIKVVRGVFFENPIVI